MRKIVLLSLLLISCEFAIAQREVDESQPPSFKERVYFGGGLGFSSGTDANAGRYTYVGLYPMIGYMVNNQLSVGTAITYQYYNYSDIGQEISQYGVSPFVRYNFGQLFAYSEFMILNTPSYDPGSSRKLYNRWLNGLGFSQPIGKRSSINAMGLYDVLYSRTDNVFSSPWVFRVYFSF